MDEPGRMRAPTGEPKETAEGREEEGLLQLETRIRRLVEELYPVLEELPDDPAS